MITAHRIAGVVSALCAIVVAGCSGSSSGGHAATLPATHSASTQPLSSSPSSTSKAADLYVSIGDSYAAGFQPDGVGRGHTTRNGFAYQVVTDAAAKGYHLQLHNFGCAGATTASVLRSPGCRPELLGPGATSYSSTQAAAAEDFLRAHRGQVALITVSIGGNDVTKCATATSAVQCVSAAVAVAKRNLAVLLTGLRSAGGPLPTIVGTTYPDVFLGSALSKDPADRQLAKLSVVGFKGLINPALQSAYAAVGGKFADVTAATGAYVPLTARTTLAPYGRIPVAVAKVCQLTYYCQYRDIHPRTQGYAIIAKLVVGLLPKR